MKIICSLFLFFLLSLSSWAADYSVLDQAQGRLKEQYDVTLTKAGAPVKIREFLQKNEAAKLKESVAQIEEFFKKYDQFNMTKIDLFMDDALDELIIRFNESKGELKKSIIKKLEKDLIDIENHYHNYGQRKKNLGKENDFERVQAARDFFNGVGNFANKLKKALGDKANRIWGVKLLPFIDNGKELAPVTDDFLQLLFSSYFRANKNKPNQAPIIDALRNISQKLAESRGTQTRWYGLENLQPMPLDGESINIFVFMHANSYFDTSVQGTLKLDGLSSIGNVDVIFPKFLAKQMIKSDHIITVGHGDILAKTEGIIRNRQLNKFFVAPEGLTPVGFYEMRPLVDLFTNSMYDLIERGLKINLYPVSFPDNFRFMNDYRRPIEGDKLAYGIIHPLLTTEELKQILAITKDRQAAAHLIRWIWFQELKNDADHDLGMPLPSVMKAWFEGMVWGDL